MCSGFGGLYKFAEVGSMCGLLKSGSVFIIRGERNILADDGPLLAARAGAAGTVAVYTVGRWRLWCPLRRAAAVLQTFIAAGVRGAEEMLAFVRARLS